MNHTVKQASKEFRVRRAAPVAAPRLTMALLVSAALLAGCASSTPLADRQFGASVRATMASQVADPAAVRNANPATGLDGAAASAAHASYVKTFAAPEPAPARLMGAGK